MLKGIRIDEGKVQAVRLRIRRLFLVGLLMVVIYLVGVFTTIDRVSASGGPCSPPSEAGWGQLEPGIYRNVETREEFALACGWGGPLSAPLP